MRGLCWLLLQCKKCWDFNVRSDLGLWSSVAQEGRGSTGHPDDRDGESTVVFVDLSPHAMPRTPIPCCRGLGQGSPSWAYRAIHGGTTAKSGLQVERHKLDAKDVRFDAREFAPQLARLSFEARAARDVGAAHGHRVSAVKRPP